MIYLERSDNSRKTLMDVRNNLCSRFALQNSRSKIGKIFLSNSFHFHNVFVNLSLDFFLSSLKRNLKRNRCAFTRIFFEILLLFVKANSII